MGEAGDGVGAVWPRRGGTARALRAAAWLTVAVLGGVVAARALVGDRWYPVFLLVAGTPFVFLPAYVLVVGALLVRNWALAAAAGVLVAVHLLWIVPGLTADSLPAGARDAPRLRVVTANVRYDNHRADELARELADADADVILAQNASPDIEDAMRATGLWQAYPHRFSVLKDDSGGQLILSRLELRDREVVKTGRFPMLLATIEVDGQAVRLASVHPVQPLTLFREHRRMTDRIVREVAAIEGPLVVGGDLNVTQFNEFHDDLTDLGLRCAHEARGRGLATTWPNGHYLAPPLRLDHLLAGRGVVVLDVRESDGAGSDHRPVIADLAVLGPSSG